jgi:hypothetical protein
VGLLNIQAFQLCGVRAPIDRSKLVAAATQSIDHVTATFVHIFVRDSVWVAIGTMLAFTPYYFAVGKLWRSSRMPNQLTCCVGLNSKPESFGHSALAILLFLHAIQAVLHAAFVYLDFAVAASITGVLTAWNSVFSGFLVAVPNLPGFWRHWAGYITPLYHTFNIVIHYDLHGLQMDCEEDSVPQLCSTGDYGLEVFQYNEVAPYKSMLILRKGLLCLLHVLLNDAIAPVAFDITGWLVLGLLLQLLRQKHIVHTNTQALTAPTGELSLLNMGDIPTLSLHANGKAASNARQHHCTCTLHVYYRCIYPGCPWRWQYFEL